MGAKETVGLPVTERVARDCSLGLLETTSIKLWSTAKKTLPGFQGGREEREGLRKESSKLLDLSNITITISKNYFGRGSVPCRESNFDLGRCQNEFSIQIAQIWNNLFCLSI